MNAKEFKEDLSNQLRDQLRGVEMNITNSFLNGKICSPLLMEASNMSSAFLNRATQTLGLLNQAGLYINEDGIEVDPHLITDTIEKFVSTSMGLVTGEMLKLKDHVTTEILRVPDTSIIMQEATYIMKEKVKDLDVGSLINFDLYYDYDEQIEQRKTKTIDDAISKFSYFCSEKVPKVTKTITYWENRIASEINNISCYIAFGPDWVIEKATYYAQFGFDFVESYIDTALNEVNQFKENVFRGAGKAVGGLMASAFDKLIVSNMKAIRNEKTKLEAKLNNEKYAKLQKGMINIMSKLGISVDVPPSQIINKEMVNKIKNETQMINIIKQFTTASSENTEDTVKSNVDNITDENKKDITLTSQTETELTEDEIVEKIKILFYVQNADGTLDTSGWGMEHGRASIYADSAQNIHDKFRDLFYEDMDYYVVKDGESFDRDRWEADSEIVRNYFTKSYNFFKFFNDWWRAAHNFINGRNRSEFSTENIGGSELAKSAEKLGLKFTSQSQFADILLDAIALYEAWNDENVENVYEMLSGKYSSSNNETVL